MAASRRTRRPRTTLLLLVLASVTIITLDARGGLDRVTSGIKSVAADAFSPIRSGVNDIVEPVGSFLAGAVHYGAVRQQNQKLEQQVGQDKEQQASAANTEQAMKALSALLNLPFVGNLQTVPAEVTNYGTTDFAATVDISVGRNQGVSLGMPVVGAGGTAGVGGLVGQVVQANKNTSTVRLITDGQSSVGVSYGSASGPLSVIDGQGSGKPLTAELIATNTPLTKGEQFLTNGFAGAIFPAGIPVAQVVKVSNGATASQETVIVQPLADLEHLRYVSVLLWGPSR
jgi:rod shape-determining protein MreC